MIRARKVREIALQILCVWDSANESDEKTALQVAMDASDEATTRVRAIEAAHGTWEYRVTADAWMDRIAPQWPPRRQPVVDRNLLRLALWEMTGGQTPQKVALDEAIELAKIYSTESSPAFVNGVLDAVLKELGGLGATGASTPT